MDAPGKDSLVGDVQVDLDHASISCPAPHTPASGEVLYASYSLIRAFAIARVFTTVGSMRRYLVKVVN